MKLSSPETAAAIRWAEQQAWPALAVRSFQSYGRWHWREVGPGVNRWLRFLTEASLEELNWCLEATGRERILPTCMHSYEPEHSFPHPPLTATHRFTAQSRRVFNDEVGFGWVSFFDPNDTEPCACCDDPLSTAWVPAFDDADDEADDREPIPEQSRGFLELCVVCVALQTSTATTA